ncbi:SGNH/GDSL hydrolase family protein [Embleya sp. NBC_00896]|uniref:SGNH/GDSL hydrolase family protein n=1 Tax=Embleya sp. NBC_00896 TaxID=2975961 RepID=UPI0038634AE2|nr:SGNH/GDSL hydrolase family protein [Embleya sp. NBC_00896]
MDIVVSMLGGGGGGVGGKRRVGAATATMVAAVLALASCTGSGEDGDAVPAAAGAKPAAESSRGQTTKPGNPTTAERPSEKAPVPPADVPVTPTTPPRPRSMAALGDSITRGFDACSPLQDCPDKSWATGTSADVNSHAKRLGLPAGAAFNNAKTGARMVDLAGQARTAVGQRVDYVTILIGANDACRRSEAEMTSPATFESQFREALGILRTGLPSARVLVVSVPDLGRMWETGHDEMVARAVWSMADVCQSMLASPQSLKPADLDRRQRVRDRVTTYNAKLREVCATWTHCRYDGGVVNIQRFGKNDVSHWDWFHPSASGQRTLAEVTSRQGYTWG